jgi:hypothetical protein
MCTRCCGSFVPGELARVPGDMALVRPVSRPPTVALDVRFVPTSACQSKRRVGHRGFGHLQPSVVPTATGEAGHRGFGAVPVL